MKIVLLLQIAKLCHGCEDKMSDPADADKHNVGSPDERSLCLFVLQKLKAGLFCDVL